MTKISKSDWEALPGVPPTDSSVFLPPPGAKIMHRLTEQGTLETLYEVDQDHYATSAPCPLCGFRGLLDIENQLGYQITYACHCPHGDRWIGTTKQITAKEYDILLKVKESQEGQ